MPHICGYMPHQLPDSLRALLDPRAYPHPVGLVELVETHISWVLLAGAFAYKLKRPVCFPFVDQREPAQRRHLCEEELRLNRRFAPQLYLDVVPVMFRAGRVCIGGDGDAIEYAVRMRRFERSEELDELLRSGRIDPDELEAFGRALAQKHAELPCVAAQEAWGTAAAIRALVMRNFAEARDAMVEIGAGEAFDALRLEGALRDRLDRIAVRLDERRAQGRVRECHGDLHARNIVRIQGALVAFDCIEFEPAFRWIDVADEASLLKSDLESRGCTPAAWAFWNGYLEQSGDFDAHVVLGLYQAHRALVRAKVAAITLRGLRERPSGSDSLRGECSALLACAQRVLEPRTPRLVLMSGLSGSGKTWLARRVARARGLVHVRSDVERHRVPAVAPGADPYSALQVQAVYQRLEECADLALRAGFDTLVDATFLQRAERARFRRLAGDCGVGLLMLQCHAPLPILEARLLVRAREGKDPSEADTAVLARQRQRAEAVTVDEDIRCVAVPTERDDALAIALAALG